MARSALCRRRHRRLGGDRGRRHRACGSGLRTGEAGRPHRESAQLARDTASEASALVVVRIEYLRGIAASQPVVRQDPPAIQALLRAMLGRRAVLDDLGWVDADGKRAIAPNRPLAQTARIDLSDRAYVKAVRRTRQPYVSDAIAGRNLERADRRPRRPDVRPGGPPRRRPHRRPGVPRRAPPRPCDAGARHGDGRLRRGRGRDHRRHHGRRDLCSRAQERARSSVGDGRGRRKG